MSLLPCRGQTYGTWSGSTIPLVLAGLLALVAIANLGHALVGSIRGRRHDFAVLKAVGFVRPQILLAVLAQALTMCVVAIVVGIPTGIALGRWLWEAFSSRTLGTLPEPAVSPPAILLIAVVGVAAGLLVAVIPGRAASLTPPSPVLKSE
jgi:ABC-type antimicrobial peptide transport system permease subunit